MLSVIIDLLTPTRNDDNDTAKVVLNRLDNANIMLTKKLLISLVTVRSVMNIAADNLKHSIENGEDLPDLLTLAETMVEAAASFGTLIEATGELHIAKRLKINVQNNLQK